MGGRVSASLEWLTHELHLSYSQLTAPHMKITYMQNLLLAFPQSSIFHVRFLCRAFCTVSFLMGITQKVLSFWSDLWSVLSVLWLRSQSDARIKRTRRPRGGLQSARALLCFLFMSLCGHSQIFLLSRFSSSPLRLSFTQWPHQFVCTLSEQNRHSVDGLTSYILYLRPLNPASLTDIFTIPTATNHYLNHRLVCQWFSRFLVWSIKCPWP